MAVNPFQFFNVGQQIGAVNSPASGPGALIRNVLQQAQKKGLLEAQSQAQLGTAKSLATFKQGLKPTDFNVGVLEQQPDGTFKVGSAGRAEVGTKFPNVPDPEDPNIIKMRERILGELGGGGAQIQAPPGNQPTPEEAQAAQQRGAVGFDPSIGQFVDANGQPI